MSTLRKALFVAVFLTAAGGSVAVAQATSRPAPATVAIGAGAGASTLNNSSILARNGNLNLVTSDGGARVTPAQAPTLKMPSGQTDPKSPGNHMASEPAVGPLNTPCGRVSEPAPMCAVAMP